MLAYFYACLDTLIQVTQLILDCFPQKRWHKVSDNARFGTEFVVEAFSQSDAPSSISVGTVPSNSYRPL